MAPIRDELAIAIARRQRQMEWERSSYEDNIQNAVDFVNPRRYDLTSDVVKGAQRKTKMYDGTAQEAFLTWVDGILGWYVSKYLVWFQCIVRDRRWRFNDRVIVYCQNYAEQMMYETQQSNFYDRLPEFLRDGAGSGTGTVLTEEHKDLTKSNHKIPHPGSVFVLEDDEGHVDVVHIKMKFTARQAIEKFRAEKNSLSEQLLKDADDPNRCETQYEFVHAIFPAHDPAIASYRIVPKLYASLHVQLGTKSHAAYMATETTEDARVIRKRGYSYNPATVWRFRKNSDEIYGYSPAMDVMCTIKALQQQGRHLLQMGNRAADPVTQMPEEMRATFSMLPRARNTYTDAQRVASILETAREYPVGRDREQVMQDLVRRRYGFQFWHAMMMLAEKSERVPAAQVMELRADQAMMLVGQVDNLGSEGITPIWNNIAAVADKGGRLPDPPPELDELRGRDAISPQFVAPLALFQEQMFRLQPVQRGLQLQAGLAQMLGPEVFDRLDRDELVEYLWEAIHAPRNILLPKEVADEIRRRRAEVQQAMQAAQQAKTMAEGISKLAKGAEPNSPLAALVGA